MPRRFIVLLSALAVLAACAGPDDLDFSIRFANTKGLAPADLVFHQGAAVGRVMGVERAQPSGFVVKVKVFRSFRDRILTGSDFAIERHRAGIAARPFVRITTIDPSSAPMPQGREAVGDDLAEAVAK